MTENLKYLSISSFEKVYHKYAQNGYRVLVVSSSEPSIAVQELLITTTVDTIIDFIKPPPYSESFINQSRVISIGSRQDEIDHARRSRFDVIMLLVDGANYDTSAIVKFVTNVRNVVIHICSADFIVYNSVQSLMK